MKPWIRVGLLIVGGLVTLVLLFFLFEWAGDFLDSGGTLSG